MNLPFHRPSETSPPLAIGTDGMAQSTCCGGQLQQGRKLVGTGAVGIVKQDFSVSVSADGKDFAHDFREIQTGD